MKNAMNNTGLACPDELIRQKNWVHGAKNTPTHNTWAGMKQRCLYPKHVSWPEYGGKGITVDPSWMDYRVFLADMGERPDGFQIDRIDNSKGYSKDNCRWVTCSQNCRNKDKTRMITFRGITLPLKTWAEQMGMGYRVLTSRIYEYGWPVDIALTTPVYRCGRKPVIKRGARL